MPLSREINCSDSDFEIIDYSAQNLLEGADFFDSLRARTKVSLWRDCLPDLSIKRLFGKFDLVKDSTFEYGGKTEILIPIQKTFTLPAGQKIYRFKLHMSAGNERTFFEAVIEHKNFPLKNDAECRLIMKYNYSEDNPYALKFVPLNKISAGFNEAVVKWERVESFNFQNLPYPKFPPAKTFSELRNLKQKFTDYREDILAKSISKLYEITESNPQIPINPDCYALIKRKKDFSYTRTLINGEDSVIYSFNGIFGPYDVAYGFLSRTDELVKNEKRYTLDCSNYNWFTNKKGEIQLVADFELDGQYYKLSFFKSNFIFQNECNTNAQILNFGIERDRFNPQFLRAQNILVSHGAPIQFLQVKNLAIGKSSYDFYKIDILLRGLLFGLHEIYFNGRSADSAEFPPEISYSLKGAFEKVYKMYCEIPADNKENLSLRDKLFNILCVASKDVNSAFTGEIENHIVECADSDKLARYEIGFVLGDFSTAMQKNLFEKIQVLNEKNIIGILAKAAWRNENFIKNFPLELTKKYFDAAIELILKSSVKAEKISPLLILELEFVMAVFRLRENADEDLSRYLSLNNPLLYKLYRKIESFIYAKSFEKTKSRVQLKVKKSVEFQKYNIPDFFYALLSYITGETGENDIVIQSISG